MSANKLLLIALIACSVSSVISHTNRPPCKRTTKRTKKSQEPKGVGSGYRYLSEPLLNPAPGKFK